MSRMITSTLIRIVVCNVIITYSYSDLTTIYIYIYIYIYILFANCMLYFTAISSILPRNSSSSYVLAEASALPSGTLPGLKATPLLIAAASAAFQRRQISLRRPRHWSHPQKDRNHRQITVEVLRRHFTF